MSSRSLFPRSKPAPLRRWAFLLLSVLLFGCAELPVPPEETEVAAPPVATEGGEGFRLSGRIGVSHNGESFSGSLRWRHSVAEDEIFILSPLGQGIARIARGPDGVTLETAEGEGYRGPDVESLTEEVLGWRLPARGLPYWVAGRPAPDGASDGEMDEHLQLRTLRQDGWRIDYLDYREVQGEMRPSKMELVMGDRLKLRLVIDSWVLP